jgi:predicted lipid-binding transport protein (Tim44 family)
MIILLILTIYVIYKLYKILGQENESTFFGQKTESTKDIKEAIVSEIKKSNQNTKDEIIEIFEKFKYLNEKQIKIIKKIQTQNKALTLEKFLQISENVYEMLLNAISAKDTANIENLVSEQFLCKVINLIAESEHISSINLVKINEAKIHNVHEDEDFYAIEIYFDSRQNIKYLDKNETTDAKEIIEFKCSKKTELTNWKVNELREVE